MRASLAVVMTLGLVLLTGCGRAPVGAAVTHDEFQAQLQVRLDMAPAGAVIQLPAGHFSFAQPLVIHRSDITLRGAGAEQTVLSFRDQRSGEDGLVLTDVAGVTLEGFAIEDAQMVGVKATHSSNLILRGLRIEWTTRASTRHGWFGAHLLHCTGLMVEKNMTLGAAVAGVFIDQSHDVVLRENRSEFNVTGIQVVNSSGVDIYRNVVSNNSAGMSLLGLPERPEKLMHRARVFDNRIYGNNTDNFAPAEHLAAVVPAGTGFMATAAKDVEFFGNHVADNRGANALVVSYLASGKPYDDPLFDPYPQRLWIHHNRFSGGGNHPGKYDLQLMRVLKFGLHGSLPDIVWDGSLSPEQSPETVQLCIRDNGDADFVNVDYDGRLRDFSRDLSPHDCELPSLAPVLLEWAEPSSVPE